MKRSALTRDQALVKLRETRSLSTDMLAPLGLSMESFLRYAQLPKDRAIEIIDKLIPMLEVKR